MQESPATAFRQQLESLYAISIEIARLHELQQVLDRALAFCLDLTQSAFGFIGLLNGSQQMDVAAIKGFEPSDPNFYDNFRLIPVRPSVFGVVITSQRSKISNDVLHDPDRVGQPRGHPPTRTFMGVPLQVGDRVIGMIRRTDRRRLAHPCSFRVTEARMEPRPLRAVTTHETIGSNLMDYLIPGSMETPKFEIGQTVTPSPHHPLGAKGVGESATVGSPAAYVNAVIDALSPYGITNIDMPVTSDKVWAALRSKGVTE